MGQIKTQTRQLYVLHEMERHDYLVQEFKQWTFLNLTQIFVAKFQLSMFRKNNDQVNKKDIPFPAPVLVDEKGAAEVIVRQATVLWTGSWLLYSTLYLYLDFHLFRDKGKIIQQGNLLMTALNSI